MSQSRARLLRLVETAIMVGLAAALSEVKIWEMPYGGSVTAGSMIPILLIALRHGPKMGMVAGALAGLANYMIDPYFVHWTQVLLEYPIAFGVLGLAGLARGRSETAGAWAGSLAIILRLVIHVAAGVIYYAEFTPEGQTPLLYSIVYNVTYMVPELIISGTLLTFLLPALRRALPTGLQAENG